MMENLPDGWRWARLGEIAEIKGGGTPRRKNPEFFSGDIPWATPTDLSSLDSLYISNTKECITEESIKRSSTTLLPENTVLMSSRATIGLVAIAKTPICTNQGFANFICKKIVVPEYLAYLLMINKDKFINLAGGSMFKEITKTALRKIPIPLPPLPEQKIIAEILQRADEIRQKRKQALGMVDEFLRSTFLEMFGDPATNPKEWDVVRLGEVCEIIMGQSPPSSTYNTQKLGLPFLQGKAEFTDLYAIPIKWCSSPKKVAEKDNILMSVRAPVGPVNLSPEKLCIGRGLCAIRGKIRKMNQRFLFHYLRFISKDLEKMGSGSTFKAITKKQVENIKIPLPPLSHQQAFARIAERAEETRKRLKQALNESEDLFNSLLDQAFTGELTAKWREEFYAKLRLSEPQGALFSILKGIPSHELPVTAMMKYGFLVQEEAGVGLGYAFEPYHYGPFTEEVYKDLNELESLGMVVQEEAGSERRIRLNYTGEVEVSEDVKEGAERILSEYGGLSLDELLERVYEKYPEYAERSKRGRGDQIAINK